MVRVTVDVTMGELNRLDNQIMAWNLCNKHKSIDTTAEVDYFQFTQNCPACIKINRVIRKSSLHLWSKLMTAYLKKSKRK